MKQFTAGANDDGLRLDRFIGKLLPHLPPSLIQRLLRQKKARLNGRHQPAGARVGTGDLVTLYFRPELFEASSVERAYLSVDSPELDVVYEDGHLLVVNKPAGQSAHEDAYGCRDALITRIQAYLYRNGAWCPEHENAFRPALCHRLDRNTGGLIMAAKTHEALAVLNEKLKLREISKYYMCVVHGTPRPGAGTLTDYIVRIPEHSTVRVSPHPVPDGRTAVTHYRTLSRGGDAGSTLTLLECRLETGRTHQIRAQWAAHGHPLLGDGKYGKRRPGDPGAQCLCAYKLSFDFRTPAGALEYLRGKCIELKEIPVLTEFYNRC